jgi:hypothetical protein
MPVHDWTRVGPGTFHDFHCSWIPAIKQALNTGVLPGAFYAQVEQSTGGAIADVLTLHDDRGGGTEGTEEETGAAVALAPPRVRHSATLEVDLYATRARPIVIRHSSDDRIVALIEVLSPGNKAGRLAFRTFVEKAASAVAGGYHLLLIDPFPPGPRDPEGIHGAVWSELGDDSYRAPKDLPLTLASYCAGPPVTAYVEPVAVGGELTSMPLFLSAGRYVEVPLEETYREAFRGVPGRWREVLEAGG